MAATPKELEDLKRSQEQLEPIHSGGGSAEKKGRKGMKEPINVVGQLSNSQAF
jgi:hypothetical protein